ncbi:MAG: acyl-CoA synthetase FdrA [Chloroflexi bacterium]|nr:acyl-CoA synthetase FdrA [Chloroflexota bacterium]
MRVAAQLETSPDVTTAALLMGTPANLEVLRQAGMLDGPAAEARPNDLIVAVRASSEDAAEAALDEAIGLLAGQAVTGASRGAIERAAPRTIGEAVSELPGANLAVISTPGAYATAEALKALKRGLHVFLFSDNVPGSDERELKKLAQRKGLLVMGPDCGTAILDGVPVGFANAVRRGRIGLVGASGTGLQQVSCLIDRLGEGVSQVIGVGGRDLNEQIGGLMMSAGIRRLGDDPETSVQVLISKPPAESVTRAVLAVGREVGQPIVTCFLGGDPGIVSEYGAIPATTLEEAAQIAVELARGLVPREAARLVTVGNEQVDPELATLASAESRRLGPGQRRLRGLYSGGTLSQEASLLLSQLVADQTPGHSVVDLGDDQYTAGRPHPMIDYRSRNELILDAARDPATAVILFDVVLGYGSHPDPASALVPVLREARQVAAAEGRSLLLVASVCGTEADPQGLTRQEERLQQVGVILASSNARAARLAAWIVNEGGQHDGNTSPGAEGDRL